MVENKGNRDEGKYNFTRRGGTVPYVRAVVRRYLAAALPPAHGRPLGVAPHAVPAGPVLFLLNIQPGIMRDVSAPVLPLPLGTMKMKGDESFHNFTQCLGSLSFPFLHFGTGVYTVYWGEIDLGREFQPMSFGKKY